MVCGSEAQKRWPLNLDQFRTKTQQQTKSTPCGWAWLRGWLRLQHRAHHSCQAGRRRGLVPAVVGSCGPLGGGVQRGRLSLVNGVGPPAQSGKFCAVPGGVFGRFGISLEQNQQRKTHRSRVQSTMDSVKKRGLSLAAIPAIRLHFLALLLEEGIYKHI